MAYIILEDNFFLQLISRSNCFEKSSFKMKIIRILSHRKLFADCLRMCKSLNAKCCKQIELLSQGQKLHIFSAISQTISICIFTAKNWLSYFADCQSSSHTCLYCLVSCRSNLCRKKNLLFLIENLEIPIWNET